MHVLVVLDHPNPRSFTAEVAATFLRGAAQAGHTTELADLHAEKFDPVWRMSDIEADNTGVVPTDIYEQQKRIEKADALCFVFPLFWWGMPAMMKGWIDRVWSWGWAYDQLEDREKSLQRPRTGILLVPAGARSDEMKDLGYTKSIETAWIDGTFGYFGFAKRELIFLNGSKGSHARRKQLLERAYHAGLDIQQS